MVPGAGLEPARLSARDFKSRVSTYSTIRAIKMGNGFCQPLPSNNLIRVNFLS